MTIKSTINLSALVIASGMAGAASQLFMTNAANGNLTLNRFVEQLSDIFDKNEQGYFGGLNFTIFSILLSLPPLVLVALATIGACFVIELVSPANPITTSVLLLRQLIRQEKGNLSSAANVQTSVDEYVRLHKKDTSVDERNIKYANLVNSYYDLATIFYEWGWSQSFHFSNRHPHESFDEATRRHEYYLASKLNLSGALTKLVHTKMGTSGSITNDDFHNNNNETGGRGSPTSSMTVPKGEVVGVAEELFREGITPSMANVKVLDVGCGIGGPMRNICKFTGADITGLTLNQYQVNRGNELCRADPHFRNNHNNNRRDDDDDAAIDGRLPDMRCRSTQGDFMKQPFDSSTFDAAYAIEATCHAPDRVGCYSEIRRVLKPGAIFACYEWCLTDKYDATNAEHVLLKKMIEEGDGLPDIATTHHCLTALKKAGFDIVEERDLVNDEYGGWQDATGAYSTSKEALKNYRGGKPWMHPLLPSWNPFTQRFQFNWLGQLLTEYILMLLEFLRIAPAGTSKAQLMLMQGAIGLARAGELGIFTPMYLMVGRVPIDKKD
jgi:sterol 24-C-methyltransferase